MLDAESQGRSLVEADQPVDDDQPEDPWIDAFGPPQSPPVRVDQPQSFGPDQPLAAAGSRRLQPQLTFAIDPVVRQMLGSDGLPLIAPSTPETIDVESLFGPDRPIPSTPGGPSMPPPPGINTGINPGINTGVEGTPERLFRDKSILRECGCINVDEMIDRITRPEFADDHEGQYGAKRWISSRDGRGIIGGDSRPRTHAQIGKASSPYRFPSVIPHNYGARKAGWKIDEAPKTHDMCISWDSKKMFSKWEIDRMNERRPDEESANQSIQMVFMERHGGAIGGAGIPGLGSIITEDDSANRTWCKECTNEINSGRCFSGMEYKPLPSGSHTSIWYHHHT